MAGACEAFLRSSALRRRAVAVEGRELGLSSVDEILNTFDDLTSCGYEERVISPTELEHILISFGRRVGTMMKRAERLYKLSNFCSLIFFAACCVALEDGQSVELLDEALRKHLKAVRGKVCTAVSKTLARYRRSVL